MDLEQDYGPGTEPEEKMLTFKDCAAADIDDVFFNTDEFANEHTINGKKLLAVLDENTLIVLLLLFFLLKDEDGIDHDLLILAGIFLLIGL